MGALLTGVTVVAAVDAETGQVHGMTANAFMSVSMEPPLVVLGVGRAAHMHGVLERSGTFGVSILLEGQEELALHMAGKETDTRAVEFAHLGAGPVLVECLASLSATIVSTIVAGDHSLVVGEVTRLDGPRGQVRALAFHRGRLAPFQAAGSVWKVDMEDVWAGSLRSSWG